MQGTQGGSHLLSLGLKNTVTYSQSRFIWSAASGKFASGASGTINLFVDGAEATSIFTTIEKPILDASSNIVKWTYHYP
jgi:hypothetical protein